MFHTRSCFINALGQRLHALVNSSERSLELLARLITVFIINMLMLLKEVSSALQDCIY